MSTTLTTAPLRAPVRVLVRQHRWAMWIVGGAAVAVALGVIAVAMRSSQVTDAFQATGCRFYAEGETQACMQTSRNYADSMNLYLGLFNNVALGLTVLPVLLGAFVAGPLVARELESGTFRMAWTQSVAPSRWLIARLAVPTIGLMAASAVLALLHWARTREATDPYPVQWFEVQVFPTMGVILPAYILFAVCTGALIGLLIRRAFIALTVSALTTGTVTIAFGAYLRAYLWPRTTVDGQGPGEENAWMVESGYLTSGGERVSPPDSCFPTAPGESWTQCLTDHDITGSYVDYHPQSHFWPLQLIETGILLALAALALALAFRVLRRLHG
nr:hypothetical protein OG284_19815 [Streptomyces sp. NBC_01177]